MILKVITDTREYNRAMAKLTKEQLPRVQVNTINAVARVVHSASEKNIREKMTIRNQYTMRSMRFSPAKVRSGGQAGYAETGSISPYLPLQETGGTVRAKAQRVPIPTVSGARMGSKAKIIAPRFRMNRLGVLGSGGTKFFYAPFRKPGIFYRKGRGKNAKLIMVRDLSRKSIKVKPTHWHTNAVKKFGTRSLMEQVFVREARKIIGAAQ